MLEKAWKKKKINYVIKEENEPNSAQKQNRKINISSNILQNGLNKSLSTPSIATLDKMNHDNYQNHFSQNPNLTLLQNGNLKYRIIGDCCQMGLCCGSTAEKMVEIEFDYLQIKTKILKKI